MKIRQNFQNLWDTAKSILRGKFIATQAYLKKQEKYQINSLTYHLQELKKIKSEVSRTKKIIKIREKINKTETKKSIVIINKIKS